MYVIFHCLNYSGIQNISVFSLLAPPKLLYLIRCPFFSCTFPTSFIKRHVIPETVLRVTIASVSFFFFLILFICSFLAVLGLRFCARAFSSCGEQGPLFIAVCEPLTIAASLVVEHKLQTRRLSSCGSRTQLLRGMWDLPRPGLEPVSPALAGRLSTTAPPVKPASVS